MGHLARNTDPDTSHAAADSLGNLVEEHHKIIMEVFEERGVQYSSEQISDIVELRHDQVWRRMNELERDMRLRKTTHVVKNRSGRNAYQYTRNPFMISEERNPAYMNPLDIESVRQCTKCSLLGRDHVPSFGTPQAKLMIIGQSPGVTEVERGMPFVGDSGALLDIMLEQAEVSREDVYIANALKCHPPNNRPANSRELKNCRTTWLRPEIKSIRPQVVLVLGKDAATSLNLLDDWGHGNVVEKKNATLIISYHPAYFLRQNDEDTFVAIGDLIKEHLSE